MASQQKRSTNTIRRHSRQFSEGVVAVQRWPRMGSDYRLEAEEWLPILQWQKCHAINVLVEYSARPGAGMAPNKKRQLDPCRSEAW
jgi:hypothetical protein